MHLVICGFIEALLITGGLAILAGIVFGGVKITEAIQDAKNSGHPVGTILYKSGNAIGLGLAWTVLGLCVSLVCWALGAALLELFQQICVVLHH